MRRLATVSLGVLTALTLVAGPAVADGPSSSSGSHQGKSGAAKQSKPRLAEVELRGVIAGGAPTVDASPGATATVGIASSATATVGLTISVQVRNGTKHYRGRTVAVQVAKGAKVELNGRRVAVTALRIGDRVEIKALVGSDGLIGAREIDAKRKAPKKAERTDNKGSDSKGAERGKDVDKRSEKKDEEQSSDRKKESGKRHGEKSEDRKESEKDDKKKSGEKRDRADD